MYLKLNGRLISFFSAPCQLLQLVDGYSGVLLHLVSFHKLMVTQVVCQCKTLKWAAGTGIGEWEILFKGLL
jgi:hypothetical protein